MVDRNTFDKICEIICKIAAKYEIPRCDVPDIIQESFLTLYEKIASGKFNDAGNVCYYMVAVGTYKCKSYLYLKKEESDCMEDVVEFPQIECDTDPATWELIEEAIRMIDTLPDTHSLLVKGHYLEHKSYDRLASELGFKNADVAKQVSARCMKKLRKMAMAS